MAEIRIQSGRPNPYYVIVELQGGVSPSCSGLCIGDETVDAMLAKYGSVREIIQIGVSSFQIRFWSTGVPVECLSKEIAEIPSVASTSLVWVERPVDVIISNLF